MIQKKPGLWGRIALIAATVFWGTSFVILKSSLDSIGILWVLALRFSIASVALMLLSRKRLRTMDRKFFKGSVIIGLLLAGAYIVQTYGLKYTTPGKNAFLTTTYCVLVPFLAWLLFRRRPNLANVLAALLCLVGIGLVSLNSEEAGINIGDILTLLCGILYSLQMLSIERYVPGGDALSLSTVEFSTAAVICWIGALLFEPAPAALSPALWGSILYMGLICTALCFFLQAWGMQYTPASTAAVILALEAVFGALISVLFYGEVMTPRLVLGFTLIFLAVVLSETGPELMKKLHRRRA